MLGITMAEGSRIISSRLLKCGSNPLKAPPSVLERFSQYLSGKGDVEFKLEELNLEGYREEVIKVFSFLKRNVPPGKVTTYGEIGRVLGLHPRFIGYCLSINRFPLIIPCHRVVSKTGLGGFSYGLDMKRELLEFERELFG